MTFVGCVQLARHYVPLLVRQWRKPGVGRGNPGIDFGRFDAIDIGQRGEVDLTATDDPEQTAAMLPHDLLPIAEALDTRNLPMRITRQHPILSAWQRLAD